MKGIATTLVNSGKVQLRKVLEKKVEIRVNEIRNDQWINRQSSEEEIRRYWKSLKGITKRTTDGVYFADLCCGFYFEIKEVI